ncbi:hypothetical protein GALMADRAFT_1125499 [Galerina marginata CBS 339.88]|uniref:Uncharacterized protein n=1 Tax=Galerina marginata (strain CBS 339.88) TaxID=685588 RepID=A0A067TDR8_GALM3|nr:hypothetical protein GALMADRAFT_1125499 [Galerina marginata CBS 339.88]
MVSSFRSRIHRPLYPKPHPAQFAGWGSGGGFTVLGIGDRGQMPLVSLKSGRKMTMKVLLEEGGRLQMWVGRYARKHGRGGGEAGSWAYRNCRTAMVPRFGCFSTFSKTISCPPFFRMILLAVVGFVDSHIEVHLPAFFSLNFGASGPFSSTTVRSTSSRNLTSRLWPTPATVPAARPSCGFFRRQLLLVLPPSTTFLSALGPSVNDVMATYIRLGLVGDAADSSLKEGGRTNVVSAWTRGSGARAEVGRWMAGGGGGWC